MKFIECLNGTVVNADYITKIDVWCCGDDGKYGSFLYLKNGEKLEFIRTFHSIQTDRMEIKLEKEHIILLNKLALEVAFSVPLHVIQNKKIEDHAYHNLEIELRHELKEKL